MWNLQGFSSCPLHWQTRFLTTRPPGKSSWVDFVVVELYMSCYYILEIKPLSVASFVNIFSQSAGCLCFMVSFAVQKLVNLVRSHCLLLLLFLLSWETNPGNNWYNVCQNVLLCSLLVLWCYVLCVSLYTILSLILCMVWECVLTSLIYTWLSILGKVFLIGLQRPGREMTKDGHKEIENW